MTEQDGEEDSARSYNAGRRYKTEKTRYFVSRVSPGELHPSRFLTNINKEKLKPGGGADSRRHCLISLIPLNWLHP